MTLNEYQTLAARTIATDDCDKMIMHALHGMVAEAGEMLEAMSEEDNDHVISECGDLFWMIAEYCTGHGWFIDDVRTMCGESIKEAGLFIEIGKLHGFYQKIFQGHYVNEEQLRAQTSRIIWQLIQIIGFHCRLEECLKRNIEKLKARYPDGFDPDRSLHRADGDV